MGQSGRADQDAGSYLATEGGPGAQRGPESSVQRPRAQRGARARHGVLPRKVRERVGFVMCRLAAVIRRLFEAGIARSGLSLREHSILCCLEEHGGSFQMEVAARTGIDRSDLCAPLARLAERQLISFELCESDLRKLSWRVSSLGRDSIAEVERELNRVETELFEILDAREREALHASLLRLLRFGERLA